MKIIYSDLQVELTRRCNQSCLHCCRGESQNVDLSKEIIDAFFEKNDIVRIVILKFSGGEPTLNGEALEYFVDKIIEKDIHVVTFVLSINGLNYDEAFVRGLNKLNEHCRKFSRRAVERDSFGTLFVSQSQFHKKASDEVISKFIDLPYFFLENGSRDYSLEELEPYGNAVKNGLTTKQPDLHRLMNHTVSINEYEGEEFACFSYHYICANGNVVTDGCVSYDLMDEYCLGNVLDKSVLEMYGGKPKIKEL